MSTYDDVTALISVSPQELTDGTVNGAGVDTASEGGTDTVSVVVLCGTVTDGSHAVTIEESDDDSTYTAIAAGNIQGSLPTVVAADDDTQKEFGVKVNPDKQYLRVVVETTAATTGAFIGAAIILGNNRKRPVH